MTTQANENKPLLKNGISFNVAVMSPSKTATSLQVICFFNFKKNQHYEGGTFTVNEQFGGEIHRLRASGIFQGRSLETLLITPLLKQIPARRLLLLGLGDPDGLDLKLIESAGYTATMEAVKLGVKDFCFAPSIKDAGITMPFGKTDISKTLAQGMLKAIAALSALSQKKLIRPVSLKGITLLAGEAQAGFAYEGLKMGIDP